MLACIFYLGGLLILVLASIPVALQNGMDIRSFIRATILIGLGPTSIKSNLPPLVLFASRLEGTKLR